MDEYVFRLPDVGEGTAEAEIVAWHVAVGDRIEEDGLLVDVMTDKATVEMTSPVDGVVKALHGEIGEMAAVGAPLAVIETEGASQAASPRSTAAASVEILRPPAPPTTAPKPSPRPPKPPPGREPPSIKRPDGEPPPMRLVARAPGAKPLASPAVRRRAVELGAPLQQVAGSGPAGRLTMADLEAFIQNPAPRTPRAGPARREGAEEVKVLGLRRRIAERMADSKRRIPHFAYVEEVDVTELEALRVHLNASRPDAPRLSALALLVLALVKTLPDFPQINATFDDEAGMVHRHRPIHVGIAAQTEAGLLVPVIRHAEALDLHEISAEIARLAEAARSGKAKAEDLRGSTITVTSLGALGGIATTPVINAPEVAILGPNKIVERPVALGGDIAIRKMMNLSSSFDHRVVDGYDAARFIQALKTLLEHPATIFMARP